MIVNSVSSHVAVRRVADLGSAVKLSDGALKVLKETRGPPPVSAVEADNEPSKVYASIQKGGQILATFYENGVMITPHSAGSPQDFAADGQDTSLADARIKQMLDMHGGSVRYAQDARMRSLSGHAATLFAAQIAGQ